MSILDHAIRELDLIGLTEEDEYNGAMRKHLLHMVEEFAKEGHSGFSASYAIQCLEKLLQFEPLSPLTGDDSEWVEVAREDGGPLYQNKRCGHVFKNAEGAYDIDGKIFWEWAVDSEGEKYRSYFTSRDSRVPVTFPYTPTRVYEEVTRGETE